MPTGTSIAYVAGGDVPPRDLPIAERAYVRVHQPVRRPSGLDWAALSPSCKDCSEKSSEVGSDGLCPGCRPAVPVPAAPADPVERPTRPATPRQQRAPRSDAPTAAQLERAEFDARAVAEYTSGRTAPEVAKLLNSNNRRVYDALARAGVTRRNDRRSNGPARIELPADEIIAAYKAGRTMSDIATDHDVSHVTIRRVLVENHVARRGSPVEHTPELIEQVRRLYVDEGLSQTEVAERLGHSAKVVQNVMASHGIPTRPAGARVAVDRSAPLKQRIADLGVTVADIKAWAIRAGHLLGVQPGIPPRRVVDAYEAAHQEQKEQISA